MLGILSMNIDAFRTQCPDAAWLADMLRKGAEKVE
jgi:hypothetical protein